MNSDQLARLIAASLARHQSRGLVDAATGLRDVVIHGRVDLAAVADEVLAEALRDAKPARRSWAAWFACEVADRQRARGQARVRARLAEQLECGESAAEIALARMRLREAEGS